jgi:hypothetical protein
LAHSSYFWTIPCAYSPMKFKTAATHYSPSHHHTNVLLFELCSNKLAPTPPLHINTGPIRRSHEPEAVLVICGRVCAWLSRRATELWPRPGISGNHCTTEYGNIWGCKHPCQCRRRSKCAAQSARFLYPSPGDQGHYRPSYLVFKHAKYGDSQLYRPDCGHGE